MTACFSSVATTSVTSRSIDVFYLTCPVAIYPYKHHMLRRLFSWVKEPSTSPPVVSETLAIIKSHVSRRKVLRYTDSSSQTESNLLSRTATSIETEPLDYSIDMFDTERSPTEKPSETPTDWYGPSRNPLKYGFQTTDSMKFSITFPTQKDNENEKKFGSSIFVFKSSADDAQRIMFGLEKDPAKGTSSLCENK